MRNLGIILFLLLTVGIINGQTNVSGSINKDSTWSLNKSPYIVIGNVSVTTGKTLTIDSGVVVRFQTSTSLYIYGILRARHALFTSNKDTIGGSPSKGSWDQIQIGDYSTNGTGVFDTCRVRYGGTNGFPSDAANVFLYSGSATFTGCDISHSKNSGIMFSGGSTPPNLTVTMTNIFSCDWPIEYRSAGSLVFNGSNNLTGNTHNGISMSSSNISSSVTLDTASVPYVFLGTTTIKNTGKLDIASTNILKFGNGVFLYVEGTLIANAGFGQKIYLTAYTDDNLGGDTNADGSATVPTSSYWGAVSFVSTSVDSLCLMRRCKISFAGYGNHGAVSMANASPKIDSCEMANNYYGAMLGDVSNPTFSNNVIGSSQIVPIAMSFAANPLFLNNAFSFSDNQYDAIGLLGGNLAANSFLPIRSVTSIPNVTYLMLDNVTIPQGITLTIQKGIVIKSRNDVYYIRPRIVVQGKLVAVGTPDSLITFTSAQDDNYGNPDDTNKDGTQSSPVIGDWSGIIFEGTSDTSSIISYCRLKYGSLPSLYYNTRYIEGGEITSVNASPTIMNCEIKDVNYGIYAFQVSNPKIWNNAIINTKYTPVAISVSANPSFIGNTFTNTKWTALGIIGEKLGQTGTLNQRTVAGISNITYLLLEDLTINSGTNVTVDPGVVIKSNQAGIFVNGGFRAKGTIAGGEIIFTSMKDDNVGRPQDTNGDGNGSSPQPGDWKTIRFQGTSDDLFCLIDSCTIKFAGSDSYDDLFSAYTSWGGVTFTDANGTISHSFVTDSYNFGTRCEGASTPLVHDVEIRNCRRDPIAMSLKSNPTFTNIIFVSNGSKGIRIIEGTLSSNATLNKRDVAGITNIAYIVEQLTISSNAVLTIEPGVVIKFPFINTYYAYAHITVNGALIAVGTAAQKIVFTSLKDDSNGGDTNNDGNNTSPARGDWWSIDFKSSGSDSLNALKNCEVRYGGSGYDYQVVKEHGVVRVFDATVRIDSCIVQQSATSGFGIYGSASPIISNVQIYNIRYTPVTMSMFSHPTFTNMSALNIGIMALGIVPETFSVNATIPKRDFAGYTNITYFLYTGWYSNERPTINSGTTITISSGTVFKSDKDFDGMLVNGGLIIEGTMSEKVVFTDTRDDAYGNPGDSNGDGSTTHPESNYSYDKGWIEMSDVSDDIVSVIKHAVFRYRLVGLDLLQASPQISQCIFDKTSYGVRLNGVSEPTLDSCLFRNLTYAPIYTSLVSYPRSSNGNVMSGSTYRAIAIVEETLVQDVTLPRRNFGGINNIPYLFGNYTVGTSAVLTITPGIVVKFFPDKRMIIRKGLIAEGGSTHDSLIVFTDIKDDFYGGDTNADSSASPPNSVTNDFYPGNWRGILFEGESLDPLCRLRHSVVRYAGYYYDAQYGGIVTNNSGPTITYSLVSKNRKGIVANGASNPVLNYCDISENNEYGIQNVNQSFDIDARWNWWGNNSGPTHSGNPGGVGQKVTDKVNYAGFFGTGALNPLTGDVSLNGNIQAFDASLVLRWLADSVVTPFNDIQKKVADVSGVSGITAYDASLILQYVVGKITIFPVEFNNSNPPAPLLPQKAALASIALNDGSMKHGKQTTVTLSAIGLNNVFSADIELSFDRTTLKVVEVKAIDIAANVSFAESKHEGVVRMFIASSKPLQSEGDLVAITFEAMDDIRGTIKSPITFSRFYLNESNFKSQAAESFITITGKPIQFALEQNYPNPFNPTTTISYQVPENGQHVTINIFNSIGQRVRELVSATQDAGEYRVTWDGSDDRGMNVAGGMYIYRMSSGSFSSVKKMLMVK